MGKYTVPGPVAEFVDDADKTIRRAEASDGVIWGVASWGPVNVVMGPFYTHQEWEKVFGAPLTDHDNWFHTRGFFNNGKAGLYYVRLAHYGDITDRATRSGTVAGRTQQTAEGGPSAGYWDATLAVAPYVLADTYTLLGVVDGGAPATATWNGAAAFEESVAATPYNLVGGETLTVKIDRGSVQTVTFQGGDFVVGGAATAIEVAQRINADLIGCAATVTAGGTKVTITSDVVGSGSFVEITGGTANVILTFPTAEIQGTGDAANIAAVTFAEVKAVIEADWGGCVVTQVGAGYARITSSTTGAGSSIQITGGTGMAALGFTTGTGTGAADAKDDTLKLEAGYCGYVSPGTAPNEHLATKIYKNARHASAGIGLDVAANIGASATTIQVVTLEGLEVGSIIKIWDVTNSEYRKLSSVYSSIVGGVAKHYVEFATALTQTYTAASCYLESREFTVEVYWDEVLKEKWDGLVMDDTADDFVESIINDTVAGSVYIYATDMDSGLGLGEDIPADDASVTYMSVSGTSEIVGLADVDYIGDLAAKTGLYAADEIADEVAQAAIPSVTSTVVGLALSQWCENKPFIYPTFCTPAGYNYTQVASWRTSTFALYSKWGSLEWPHYQVYDHTVGGNDPRRTVSPECHVMGLRARVDAIPGKAGGGVWSSAAGSKEFGAIADVIDLETSVGDTEQNVLNPLGVNCTRRFKKDGIVRYGARTLSNNKKWLYEATTRFFLFAAKSVVDSTRWATLRNNDFRLWRRLEQAINEFMESLFEDRAFPGTTFETCWDVKTGIDQGVMTQTDYENGLVVTEVRMAPHIPGEFLPFRFSQMKGGGSSFEAL